MLLRTIDDILSLLPGQVLYHNGRKWRLENWYPSHDNAWLVGQAENKRGYTYMIAMMTCSTYALFLSPKQGDPHHDYVSRVTITRIITKE